MQTAMVRRAGLPDPAIKSATDGKKYASHFQAEMASSTLSKTMATFFSFAMPTATAPLDGPLVLAIALATDGRRHAWSAETRTAVFMLFKTTGTCAGSRI